jgi:hypothetical protein
MKSKKRKIRSAFPGYILIPQGDFYQAKKIGATAERIKTDPAYDLTRRNAAEFGKVAKFGKAIRQAFAKHVPIEGITPALNKVLRKVLDTDKDSIYGNRSFKKADSAALNGFQFNPDLSFEKMVRAEVQVDYQPEKKLVKITIPAFDPVETIHEENNLPHYRIAFVLVAIDLVDNTWVSEHIHTGIIPRKHIKIKQQQLRFEQVVGEDRLYLLAATLEYYGHMPDSKMLVRKECAQPLTIIKAFRPV